LKNLNRLRSGAPRAGKHGKGVPLYPGVFAAKDPRSRLF
jgi:hypothetical protein